MSSAYARWVLRAFKPDRESGGALFSARHSPDARIGLQLRTGFERRHREVELHTFGFARERQSNRMKERLAFQTGALAHARSGRPKRIPIAHAITRPQLVGQRDDHRASARLERLGADR